MIINLIENNVAISYCGEILKYDFTGPEDIKNSKDKLFFSISVPWDTVVTVALKHNGKNKIPIVDSIISVNLNSIIYLHDKYFRIPPLRINIQPALEEYINNVL